MKTKLIVLIMGLSLAFCPFLHAQVGAGLFLSGVASQIDGDSWGGYKKLGFNFGGFAWFEFNERLGIQPEISYGNRGSREVQNGYGQFSMDFIDIPVLLRVNVYRQADWKFVGEAGPSANILLRMRNGFNDLRQDNTEFYSKLNAELHLGLSAYSRERLGVFLRWSVGLNNLWAATPQPWMTIHYFSLGVRLGFISAH